MKIFCIQIFFINSINALFQNIKANHVKFISKICENKISFSPIEIQL